MLWAEDPSIWRDLFLSHWAHPVPQRVAWVISQSELVSSCSRSFGSYPEKALVRSLREVFNLFFIDMREKEFRMVVSSAQFTISPDSLSSHLMFRCFHQGMLLTVPESSFKTFRLYFVCWFDMEDLLWEVDSMCVSTTTLNPEILKRAILFWSGFTFFNSLKFKQGLGHEGDTPTQRCDTWGCRSRRLEDTLNSSQSVNQRSLTLTELV